MSGIFIQKVVVEFPCKKKVPTNWPSCTVVKLPFITVQNERYESGLSAKGLFCVDF